MRCLIHRGLPEIKSPEEERDCASVPGSNVRRSGYTAVTYTQEAVPEDKVSDKEKLENHVLKPNPQDGPQDHSKDHDCVHAHALGRRQFAGCGRTSLE